MAKRLFILIAAITLGLFSGLSAQVPTFQTGDLVRISWIAPPDTDVVAYRAYFINCGPENQMTMVELFEWNVDTTIGTANFTLALIDGEYELMLTAVDRAGNESLPSDAFPFIISTDLAPGRPLNVVMELVPNNITTGINASAMKKVPVMMQKVKTE